MMTATAFNPPRLRTDAVHDRLRRAILSGRYAPGETLPSERSLSDAHRVNRHAVREAIKRLQQAGLVHITSSGTAAVLDWRATGGIDLLGDLAANEEIEPLLRSVAEMRATLGADAARLCAQRAPSELRDELRELGAALRTPTDRPRFQDRFAGYERLWAAIVDGSGNVAYRLAYNSLATARNEGGIDPEAFADEVDDPEAARALAVAVADGDAPRAEVLARELLERAVRAAGD